MFNYLEIIRTEDVDMKKRIFSSVVAVGVSLISLVLCTFCDCAGLTAFAAESKDIGIRVDFEYVIPDSFNWCTYYVVVATNTSGKDIAVSADFAAIDTNGNVISKTHDYAEAVKKDQQFILYGQFQNKEIGSGVRYQYQYKTSDTENCTYTSVDLDASNIGGYVEVSATNYSEKDIQGVGVRSVFFRNGKAVAFDTVNIADVGYVFYGGSTNSQVLGHNAGSFDDYIITYTSAGNQEIRDF